MIFARRVFLAAGIIGLAALAPMYFLERLLGERLPPAINHPEIYYGFVGVVLVWQIGYILIGLDPARYRPFMILAALGKGSFALATFVLMVLGRTPGVMLPVVLPDAVFAALFVAAFWLTGREPA